MFSMIIMMSREREREGGRERERDLKIAKWLKGKR
jgi:hypothetical protein